MFLEDCLPTTAFVVRGEAGFREIGVSLLSHIACCTEKLTRSVDEPFPGATARFGREFVANPQTASVVTHLDRVE